MIDISPGLCSVTFRHLGAGTVVELAREAGIEGIEWAGDSHVPPGDLDAAAAAARCCSDAGIACPSYGSYWRAGEHDPSGAGLPFDAVLDTASALGAPNVRVWTNWASATHSDAPDRMAIAEALAAIAGAARRRGMTVSLEFHAYTLTETAASTLRLLDEAGRPPNLYTYWQPVEGLGPGELLGELRAVRADVSHLHVFRWRSHSDRFALADGEDLWPAALATVGGDPSRPSRWEGRRYAFLEFVRGDDPGQFRADAAVLRTWLGGVPGPTV